MLEVDLQAAGIEKENGQGIVDFHSLRHTFGTMLAKAGVAPKVAMDLMRHSDVNLTMGLYSHTVLQDRADALEKLPLIGLETAALSATGTDDILPVGGSEEGEGRLTPLVEAGGVSDNPEKQVDRKMDRSLGQNGCILSQLEANLICNGMCDTDGKQKAASPVLTGACGDENPGRGLPRTVEPVQIFREAVKWPRPPYIETILSLCEPQAVSLPEKTVSLPETA